VGQLGLAPSSLDAPFASARIYTVRRTVSGGLYQVSSDSLAEDVELALRLDGDRIRRNGWQRRKRLLRWAVPGVELRLQAGRVVRLVTLPAPGLSMAHLAHAWLAFRMRIERRAGELEFCGTRAIGSRTGVPHVHVLCDWGSAWVSQSWLSIAWLELTGYGVVDVRQVRSAGAARYVAANVAGYVSDQAGGRMFRSAGWLRSAGDAVS
jgi:hypothetical protein